MREPDHLVFAEWRWVAGADAAIYAHFLGAQRRRRWRHAPLAAELSTCAVRAHLDCAEALLTGRRDIALGADEAQARWVWIVSAARALAIAVLFLERFARAVRVAIGI